MISGVIELKESIWCYLNDLTYIEPCIQIQNGSSGHFEYISGD